MSDKDYQTWLKGVIPLTPSAPIHPEFGRPNHQAIKSRPKPIRDQRAYREQQTFCHNFDRIEARLFHAMQYERVHVSKVVDLHGLYVHKAQNILSNLLLLRQNRHLVFWRVIHGKGKNSPLHDRAPIKHAIIEQLMNHDAVAAMVSIHDSDGASGSVLIAVRAKDY